ncbi:MAG: redoxin domain-containing protein [Planctomycetaceae bacterium]|nr:redoxin domain-containing protein [Planctomycetaceae bacterium]
MPQRLIHMRLGGIFVLALLTGCGGGSEYGGYDGYGYAENIQFKDTLTANADPGDTLTSLAFTTPDGEAVPLDSLANGKRLVLVVTRGATGAVCPYCSTQVSQLISNYSKFVEKNAEVVVVYPVQKIEDRKILDSFLTATKQRLNNSSAKVPFPLLLDVELKAVDALGIRKDLSKPATYVLDADRQVRFAYVGTSLADRPSIKALLEQLDAIPTEGK